MKRLLQSWGGGGGATNTELQAEARRQEELIREQILRSGLEPTTTGQYQLAMDISLGGISTSIDATVTIDVHPSWAPIGAARFKQLWTHHYYDGCKFFRVVPGFMVQFGLAADPMWARAGPSWAHLPAETQHDIIAQTCNLRDDPVLQGNQRGRISFAHAGPNTRTTQLFINLVDNSKPGHRPYPLHPNLCTQLAPHEPLALTRQPLRLFVNMRWSRYSLDSKGFAAFAQINEEGMAIIDRINAEYAEEPRQDRISMEGNRYLEGHFPRLSSIVALRPLTSAAKMESSSHDDDASDDAVDMPV